VLQFDAADVKKAGPVCQLHQTALLAETGGSSRHKATMAEASLAPKRMIGHSAGFSSPNKPKPKAALKPKERSVTSAIPVHFPKQLRDQLKILAIQHGDTVHGIVAEAFNDFFAKHGKPEISLEGQHGTRGVNG
jgi:hypothetical protein